MLPAESNKELAIKFLMTVHSILGRRHSLKTESFCQTKSLNSDTLLSPHSCEPTNPLPNGTTMKVVCLVACVVLCAMVAPAKCDAYYDMFPDCMVDDFCDASPPTYNSDGMAICCENDWEKPTEVEGIQACKCL
ncbi:hypothetical protein EGW08_012934 [Elysia chlorotica]|uniref:Uncharacterized protein n=1 Tax=Elysia chlorotica TaxID=188477 RepID=A0A3S1BA38_ELYCH|nr:hypothetical protein EGW08_012934 [Elysia chlorotica]